MSTTLGHTSPQLHDNKKHDCSMRYKPLLESGWDRNSWPFEFHCASHTACKYMLWGQIGSDKGKDNDPNASEPPRFK